MDFSHWQLIREIGIDSVGTDPRGASQLRGPRSVEPLQGGREFLVLDKCPGDDRVWICDRSRMTPLRLDGFRCRSSFVCSVSTADADHFLVVAGNAPREILLLDRAGVVRGRVWSSQHPGALHWPTCAVAYGDGVLVGDQASRSDDGDVPAGLVLLTRAGRLRWAWRPGKRVLGEPTHLAVTRAGPIIVTDSELHRVLQVFPPGRVGWSFGWPGCPRAASGCLASPSATCVTPSGTLLICDTRNDRLVTLSAEGRELRSFPSARDEFGVVLSPFCNPTGAFQAEDGTVVVADSGNKRVVSLDEAGRVVRCIGPSHPPRRLLSFPRSVEVVAPQRWLIADTNHNRVVELDADNRIRWQFGCGRPRPGCTLWWPRAARRLADGTTLISDSLNGRLLLVSPSGEVLRETRSVRLPSGEVIALRDPHDAVPTPAGTVLLVDSLLPMAAEVTPEGTALWTAGLPQDGVSLGDPHQLIRIGERQVLIADPHNARLVVLNTSTLAWEALSSLRYADGRVRPLSRPKSLLRGTHFTAITDSFLAEFQLIVQDDCGVAYGVQRLDVSEFFHGDEDMKQLHEPRGLAFHDGRLLVSDWSAHRVLELAPAAPVGGRRGHGVLPVARAPRGS